jgi:16S rRNA processing protein RimM
MDKPQYFSIGQIKKPFGNQGFLSIDLNEEAYEIIDSLKHIFIYLDGAYIPFFIESIDEKSDLIIKLEEVENPEHGSKITNHKIYVTQDQIGDESTLIELQTDMIDYKVYNYDNLLSTIKDLEAFPSQLMALIEYKGEDKMIPLVEEFIKTIDHKKKAIYLELPEGILEL